MKFSEIVDQAVELLRTRGRISYRALQRELALDDADLDDLNLPSPKSTFLPLTLLLLISSWRGDFRDKVFELTVFPAREGLVVGEGEEKRIA